MKRNLILLFAVFVFAIFVIGCDGENSDNGDGDKDKTDAMSTSNEEADKALDALNLKEKAPTLGPVYRDYFVKFFKDDYEGCWNILSEGSQQSFGKIIQPAIDGIKTLNEAQIDAELKALNAALPTITDSEKKVQTEFQIKLYEAGKNGFKDLPDTKSCFVLYMKLTPKAAIIEKIKNQEIIKEEIAEDGKTGVIKRKESEKESEKKFVYEDDRWKMVKD